MEQPQYSALHRRVFEVDYQPLFAQYGYGTTIWSPLASGLLTGKYSGGVFPKGSRLAHAQNAWLQAQLVDGEDGGGNGINGLEVQEPKAALAMADKLAPIAKKLGCTQAQLALAWCIKNTDVYAPLVQATPPFPSLPCLPPVYGVVILFSLSRFACFLRAMQK